MLVDPGRLKVRRVRPLDLRPFVPIETEPLHALENAADHVGRRSLEVGVFDPQDERTAGAAGVEPVEKRRARAADVQVAGRRRRESQPRRHKLF